MAVTDGREYPLARADLYRPGHGFNGVSVRNTGSFYDILAETWPQGSSSRDANGRPLLEHMEGVGIVCRPFINLKSSRLSHYTLSDDGDWDEQIDSSGTPRIYRLLQLDLTDGLEWSAESNSALPANPSVAFSFALPEPPADWDEVTIPPYTRLEFGGEWALLFDRLNGGTQLGLLSGDTYEPVLDIPEPVRAAGASRGDEFLLLVRCLRGRIWISSDFGRSYVSYGDGTIHVPSAAFTLRGGGGAVLFGLHQIEYQAGVYTAPTRNTFTPRLVITPTLTPVVGYRPDQVDPYLVTSGTSVSLNDTGDHDAGIAGYTATLTPNELASSFGFSFYRTPELYAVRYEFPTVARTLGNSIDTTGLLTDLREVAVTKPLELDSASASLRCRLDPDAEFDWTFGRYPLIKLWLGHRTSAGADHLVNVFTGFLEDPSVDWNEYRDVEFSAGIQNTSWLFRRRTWEKLETLPLGGMTINAALDWIIGTEGLDASYRSWHARGDLVTLPRGLPEDPFEWANLYDEEKWVTMARVAGYAGMELAVFDDGRYATGPRNYVNPALAHTWEAVPETELQSLVRRLRYRMDSAETATCVVVEGVDLFGLPFLIWARNARAEGNPFARDFCPWRETVSYEMPAPCPPTFAIIRAQSLAMEHFPLKEEIDLTIPVDLTVLRRDRGQITGSEVAGADPFWRWVVLTLRHVYQADPSFVSLDTTAGLLRVS